MRVIRGGSELPSHDATGFVEQPLAVLRAPHVAALNLSPEPGDVEGNLRLAERAATEAKRAHPDLAWVVLPELFTTAYSDLASVHRYAESAEWGPSARFFAALARELGLHVAYGFPERLPGGSVSDSANLLGPGGVLLTYRKRHLVRATGEDRVFVPGTELPVVEAGGMRVALVVCWDLGFPQTVREAALAGARLILSPAGWRHPWGPQYDLSCAARALDNAVYLASANQLGAYPRGDLRRPGQRLRPRRDPRFVAWRQPRRRAQRRQRGSGVPGVLATLLREHFPRRGRHNRPPEHPSDARRFRGGELARSGGVEAVRMLSFGPDG